MLLLFTLPLIRISKVEKKNSIFLSAVTGLLIAGVLIFFANIIYLVFDYKNLFVTLAYSVSWRDVLVYKLPFFTCAIFFFAFALFFVAVARIKKPLVFLINVLLAVWLSVSALSMLYVITTGINAIIITKIFSIVAWLFVAVVFFVNAFAKDKVISEKRNEGNQTQASGQALEVNQQAEQPLQVQVSSVPPTVFEAQVTTDAQNPQGNLPSGENNG